MPNRLHQKSGAGCGPRPLRRDLWQGLAPLRPVLDAGQRSNATNQNYPMLAPRQSEERCAISVFQRLPRLPWIEAEFGMTDRHALSCE